MQFTFATANAVHFGPGISKKIRELLPSEVNRIFLVTGAQTDRHPSPIDALRQNEIAIETFPIAGEPSTSIIQSAVDAARAFDPQAIIGLGGGSAIDAGKAVAILLANPGNLVDYLEGVGSGKPIEYPSLPYMAIPTTAGTGSEVTRNSVLSVPGERVKVSLRSPHMVPRWAVVDPELTYELPAALAASTGMDAFIQCLEAYLSRNANPISDGVALEGLARAARSLKAACGETLDREAKADLCVASLCGGMALANAKLGAVHGFAGPIGGMIDAPHGALCASLLLPVLRTNFDIVMRREPQGPISAKFDNVARVITRNPAAKGSYALAWIEALLKELPLPTLSELGFSSDGIPEAVSKAVQSSSMQGNPIDLAPADLREILQDALEMA